MWSHSLSPVCAVYTIHTHTHSLSLTHTHTPSVLNIAECHVWTQVTGQGQLDDLMSLTVSHGHYVVHIVHRRWWAALHDVCNAPA